MSRNVRVAGSLHEEGENIRLHRFALFTACSTAFLIFVGGLVTSTQAGQSVPDWPTQYGATGSLIFGTLFLLTLRVFSMVAREMKWQ
jgi:hypothetical protein